MKTRIILVVFLIRATLIGIAQAQGTLIYSSLGPGNSYDIHSGAGVGGPGSSNGRNPSGFSFIPTTTLMLDTVQLAIGTISGTNAFSLLVQSADGPSGIPGTVLETFQISGQMQPFGLAYPLISVTSVARPELEAGTTYWLVAVGVGNAAAAWNINNVGITGDFYSFQQGQDLILNNQSVAAFQISGVPEPSGVCLFILGFGILTLQVFHSYCGRMKTCELPNKSPEPTTVGAGRSAIAVHVAGRRWLSFFR